MVCGYMGRFSVIWICHLKTTASGGTDANAVSSYFMHIFREFRLRLPERLQCSDFAIRKEHFHSISNVMLKYSYRTCARDIINDGKLLTSWCTVIKLIMLVVWQCTCYTINNNETCWLAAETSGVLVPLRTNVRHRQTHAKFHTVLILIDWKDWSESHVAAHQWRVLH